MFVVCVTSKVKPQHIDAYLEASLANARETRKEAGNLRFDVLRGAEDPNQVFFYEVYRDKADFTAHQQTAHYFAWKDKVKDWLSEPRSGVKYASVFPDSDGGWAA